MMNMVISGGALWYAKARIFGQLTIEKSVLHNMNQIIPSGICLILKQPSDICKNITAK